jgi:hypothetical protein
VRWARCDRWPRPGTRFARVCAAGGSQEAERGAGGDPPASGERLRRRSRGKLAIVRRGGVFPGGRAALIPVLAPERLQHVGLPLNRPRASLSVKFAVSLSPRPPAASFMAESKGISSSRITDRVAKATWAR